MSPPTTQSLTAPEKAAITRRLHREAQQRQDAKAAAEASTRPPRQAMLKAKEKSVWINNDATSKKRTRRVHSMDKSTAQSAKQSKQSRIVHAHPEEYDDVDEDEDVDPEDPASDEHIEDHKGQDSYGGQRNPSESDRISDEDTEDQAGGSDEDASDEVEDIENTEDEIGDTMEEEPLWTLVKNHSKEKVLVEDSDKALSDDEADLDLEYARQHGVSSYARHQVTTSRSARKTSATNTRTHPITTASGKGKKVSVMAKRLSAEVPNWSQGRHIRERSPNVNDDHSDSPPSYTGSDIPSAQPPTYPPLHIPEDAKDREGARHFGACTRINWTGKGRLALLTCHPAVQDIFHKALTQMKLYCVLTNAYIDDNPCRKAPFLRSVLTKAAMESDGDKFISRLGMDRGFREKLIEGLSTRLSQFRGLFKATAAGKIVAYYHLDGSQLERTRRAIALLREKRYVFPGDAQLEKDKPYGHGILSDVLKDVLVPHRHSLLIEHNNLLEVKWGGETSFEIPKSAIALAATAVHAAIQDYQQGVSDHAEFLANRFAKVYKAHMAILDDIERQKPLAFHRLGQKMYEDVIGTNVTIAATADAAEVIEQIDWARIEG